MFLAQISELIENEEEICTASHQTSKKIFCITFILEDIQVKNNKHYRPLYYKGYIGLIVIDWIQIDHGSTLSIMPRKILWYFGISTNRLITINTTIFSFNANDCKPLGKVKVTCQVSDLKMEVRCYVIDTDL